MTRISVQRNVEKDLDYAIAQGEKLVYSFKNDSVMNIKGRMTVKIRQETEKVCAKRYLAKSCTHQLPPKRNAEFFSTILTTATTVLLDDSHRCQLGFHMFVHVRVAGFVVCMMVPGQAELCVSGPPC